MPNRFKITSYAEETIEGEYDSLKEVYAHVQKLDLGLNRYMIEDVEQGYEIEADDFLRAAKDFKEIPPDLSYF